MSESRRQAIPEPLFIGWRLRKFRCPCKGWGRESPTFKRRIDYEEHYFHEHIIGAEIENT